MKKSKVSLGLRGLSPAEKVEFARAIVLSMTGNISFSNAAVLIAALTVASDDLETAIMAAQDKSKTQIAIREQKEEVLDDVLTQVANHVDSIAKGDPAVILSAGLPLRRSNNNPVPLNQVQGLSASPRSIEGELELSWNALKYCRAYVVEQYTEAGSLPADTKVMPTDSAAWKVVQVLTAKKFKLSGLKTGNWYSFRVYGVGTAGNGKPSEVILAKAL
ncbi:MAG: fibronectin type III domain-containing protein [Bacteroidetes bacterium]|nr:fibronectin type III domain-containing protein [Bacteroidota bacterium]